MDNKKTEDKTEVFKCENCETWTLKTFKRNVEGWEVCVKCKIWDERKRERC